MKILAIGAHPDDLEICCFGTLARCIERGDEVTVCTLTNGNLGHSSMEKGDLREVRLAEAAKSASVIGASFCTLDIDDLALDSSDEETRRKMVDLLCSVQPDIVITHSEEDYHSDHVEAARLVWHSLLVAPLAKENPLKGAVILYEMDMVGGGTFIPTEFVDITTTMELKMEALSHHQSQLEFLMESGGRDLLSNVRVLSQYRGLQCGCHYAEGFRLSARRPSLAQRVLP
jgi:LmbE family N-acetylglucosaminyl deacetylase